MIAEIVLREEVKRLKAKLETLQSIVKPLEAENLKVKHKLSVCELALENKIIQMCETEEEAQFVRDFKFQALQQAKSEIENK